MVCRLRAWGIPYMMTHILSMPKMGAAFVTAAVFLLPIAHVNAQGSPVTGTPKGEASPDSNSLAPMTATESKRAQAYYHLEMASVYEDDATSEGRSDEVNKAIEEYKMALNDDPDSAELNNGLADLYFRVGRMHDAEVTARAMLKNSPNDIDAHRLLAGSICASSARRIMAFPRLRLQEMCSTRQSPSSRRS